jgi:hypothetical protein
MLLFPRLLFFLFPLNLLFFLYLPLSLIHILPFMLSVLAHMFLLSGSEWFNDL